MKYYSKLLAIMVFIGLCAITCEAANTWYVDDDNYKDGYDAAAYIEAGFDGTTEAKAFGTLCLRWTVKTSPECRNLTGHTAECTSMGPIRHLPAKKML